MAVSSDTALAIATLIFYVLAGPFAIYVGIRHGVKKSGPWYFFLLLSLVRLIGEPMLIAANVQSLPPTSGVFLAGFILSAIGLSPLLLAVGALIQQVNAAFGAQNSRIPPQIVRLIGLIPLVALILSSIGGSDAYSDDAGTRSTGQTLRVASTALYLAYLGLLVACCWLLYRAQHLLSEQRAHVFFGAAVVSMPFLLVRTIYSGLTTFGSVEAQRANAANVLLKALMGSLMEFVVVIVCLAAGVVAAPAPKVSEGEYTYERSASRSDGGEGVGRELLARQGQVGQQTGVSRV